MVDRDEKLKNMIINNHELINIIDESEYRTKYLACDIETKELCVLTVMRKGNINVYKKLIKHNNLNLIKYIKVWKTDDNYFATTEEYHDGAKTLRHYIDNNLEDIDFEDCILQICDAMIFLSKSKLSITHTCINPDNVLICDDGVTKLINFENAEFGIDCSVDIKLFGILLASADKKNQKKYRNIINNCINTYKTPHEVKNDIQSLKRVLGIKYSIFVLITISLIIITRIIYIFTVRNQSIIDRILP